MFAMFFLGAIYLQRVLGYDALETGLAFLPVTVIIGTLSLRYAERLITRLGARGTLLPGLGLILAGLLLFTQAPVDGSYVVHVLPVMVLLGAGAGLAFPALMTLSMSGARRATRASPPAWSTRRCRSAARSGSPCWRRWRRRARRRCTPPATRRSPRSTAASTSPT
jgi:hypothetical protein